MPSAPPRVCARCGGTAPRGQRCACTPPWEGSNHPGSNSKWRLLRDAYKRAYPICEVPGCRRPVHDFDHITPIAEGGSRWDPSNWQSLCEPHHLEKTSRDARRGKTRLR